MLDVGCGTGETALWFKNHGVQAVGLDGLLWNVRKCEALGVAGVVHDFTRGAAYLANVDLIWCADVAEHIEEKFVGNLLETLRHCRVLAFAHGTDANADEGYHHVNNQPESYWIEKLASVGMVELPIETIRSREVGNHGWWPYSGRIYAPKGK